MKTVIIFDHPYGITASHNQPHKRSYFAALAQQAIKDLKDSGNSVDIIDLQKDNFNPVMSKNDLLNWRTKSFVDKQSQNYFDRLQDADEIIFIFPIWWEMMPALTKGFIDKVFAKGQIKKANGHRLILPVKTKIRVLTAIGTPKIIYKFHYGNPLGKMLKRGVFGKMGLKDFKIINFNAEDRSKEQRINDLKKIKKIIL
ncbi:NAD(P)H-dependent oxidoreductase [Oenococcus oeni]|uniref:NAD(P)H-dependent oxidoreductase n=2 Tax=Oenococcus oeni TaxID=1247 RepID=UPI0008F84E2E|nr:NAD(P)H-dependent oxidoreductase [Oenococcus oeni]OIM24219.1 NADPH:quinone reductase [Oenococcus oeni]SYW16326.1 putative NAD(P)H oxidoreductase [Oenococcus oeni]